MEFPLAFNISFLYYSCNNMYPSNVSQYTLSTWTKSLQWISTSFFRCIPLQNSVFKNWQQNLELHKEFYNAVRQVRLNMSSTIRCCLVPARADAFSQKCELRKSNVFLCHQNELGIMVETHIISIILGKGSTVSFCNCMVTHVMKGKWIPFLQECHKSIVTGIW